MKTVCELTAANHLRDMDEQHEESNSSLLVLRNQLLELQKIALEEKGDGDVKVKQKFSLALIYRLLSNLSFVMSKDVVSGYNCLLLSFRHLLEVPGVKRCQELRFEAGMKLATIQFDIQNIVEGHQTVDTLAVVDEINPNFEKQMVSNEFFVLYRDFIREETGLLFENEIDTTQKLRGSYQHLMERDQMLSGSPISDDLTYSLNLVRKEMKKCFYNSIEWINHVCDISFRAAASNEFKQSIYLIHAASSVLKAEFKVNRLENDWIDVDSYDQVRSTSGRICITIGYHCYNLLSFIIKCATLTRTFGSDFDKLLLSSNELKFNTKPMVEFDLTNVIDVIDPVFEEPSFEYGDIGKIYDKGLQSLEKAKKLLNTSELISQNFHFLHENYLNLRSFIISYKIE